MNSQNTLRSVELNKRFPLMTFIYNDSIFHNSAIQYLGQHNLFTCYHCLQHARVNEKRFLLFPDSHSLNLRTDDIYLTRFLNCCEWNVTDAFIRMTKLFKLKVKVTINVHFHEVFLKSRISLFSTRIRNGFPTESSLTTPTSSQRTPRWCLVGETRRGDESMLHEWVSENVLIIFIQFITLFIKAEAGHLNLIDLAQLDDLWMEAMLNEIETIENGIVVLVDMSG